MRALIIQNNLQSANTFQTALSRTQIHSEIVDLGGEFAHLSIPNRYDLICYSLLERSAEGIESLIKIRFHHRTPVMIISDRPAASEKLRWFAGGADDYVEREIADEELQARIHAIVRRDKGHAKSVITVGKLEVDLQSRTVRANDLPIYLTKMQFRTLEALALNTPRTLSNDYLVNYFCSDGNPPSVNTIQQAVSGIRKKLRLACYGINYIHSSFIGGYALFN
ncbi:MAG: ctrA [Sphingomonadales bacterium]|nr:ctrA [Sphingomonadales bacterium]